MEKQAKNGRNPSFSTKLGTGSRALGHFDRSTAVASLAATAGMSSDVPHALHFPAAPHFSDVFGRFRLSLLVIYIDLH